MFRASLRPSSGGQTAFSLPVDFCPIVTVVTVVTVTTVTTGQKSTGSENAV